MYTPVVASYKARVELTRVLMEGFHRFLRQPSSSRVSSPAVRYRSNCRVCASCLYRRRLNSSPITDVTVAVYSGLIGEGCQSGGYPAPRLLGVVGGVSIDAP